MNSYGYLTQRRCSLFDHLLLAAHFLHMAAINSQGFWVNLSSFVTEKANAVRSATAVSSLMLQEVECVWLDGWHSFYTPALQSPTVQVKMENEQTWCHSLVSCDSRLWYHVIPVFGVMCLWCNCAFQLHPTHYIVRYFGNLNMPCVPSTCPAVLMNSHNALQCYSEQQIQNAPLCRACSGLGHTHNALICGLQGVWLGTCPGWTNHGETFCSPLEVPSRKWNTAPNCGHVWSCGFFF